MATSSRGSVRTPSRVQARSTDGEAGRSSSSPSRDDIARRAYEFYLERGGADGQALDDWLKAEREAAERPLNAAGPHLVSDGAERS